MVFKKLSKIIKESISEIYQENKKFFNKYEKKQPKVIEEVYMKKQVGVYQTPFE